MQVKVERETSTRSSGKAPVDGRGSGWSPPAEVRPATARRQGAHMRWPDAGCPPDGHIPLPCAGQTNVRSRSPREVGAEVGGATRLRRPSPLANKCKSQGRPMPLPCAQRRNALTRDHEAALGLAYVPRTTAARCCPARTSWRFRCREERRIARRWGRRRPAPPSAPPRARLATRRAPSRG